MTDITVDAIGTFEIRTVEGTGYILELAEDGQYLTRKPWMARPDGYPDPVRLSGDFTRLALVTRPEFVVGKPARVEVLIGEQPVTRRTSTVTEVHAA